MEKMEKNGKNVGKKKGWKEDANRVVLVSLLLTLNIFHTLL